MIATLAGVLLAAAVLLAPRHGILGRRRAALDLADTGLTDTGLANNGLPNNVVSDAVTR